MVRARKVLLFLIFLIINVDLIMASESTRLPEYYYLSVKTKDVKFIMGINNAPLIRDDEGDGIITAEPVSTWLIKGENTLSINLYKLDDKSKTRSPSVEVQLYLHDSAFTTPTPKKVIAEYYYPPRKDEKTTEFPLSKSISFNFPVNVGTQLWKEAETLSDVSENDKNEIIVLIKALETSLLNKDISSTISLQKYKIQDDALAEKKPVEQLENATRKSYEWLNEQRGLTINNITLNDTSFKICCKNKVVFVSRINGTDALQLESDDLYFDIPIFVSKINKKWTIVR